MTRLVLFDLDGTLVDSSPGIHASIRVAATALGLPDPTSTQLTGMVGPPLQDGFATEFGLAGEDVDRAVAAYRAHYTAGAMLDAPVYPGIADLLAVLHADGATLAVATSKPEAFARAILEHVGLAGAFHPDGERPVLVGDRAQDVVGARVHGLPCVGAGWGPARPGELAQAGAAVVCASPADVPGALAVL